MRIIDEAKASEYLVSRAAYIIEGKIWIAPNNSNSIIECSLKSKTAENIYGIDEPAKEYMFSRIVKINNELYFIPADAEDMWCIDLENRKLRKIDIGLTNQEKSIKYKFGAAIANDNNKRLFLIGSALAGIIKLDTITGECCRIEDLNDRGVFKEEGRLYGAYAVCNNVIYAPFYGTSSVLRLDINNDYIEIISIDKLPKQYYSYVCSKDGDLYFYGPDDNEYIIDTKNKRVKLINQLAMIKKDKNRRYAYVYHGKNRTIYLPVVWSSVYIDNKDESELIEYKVDQKKLNGIGEGHYSRYEFVVNDDERLYFQSRIDGEIYEINLKSLCVDKFYMKISQECLGYLIKNRMENSASEVVVEDSVVNLSLFVKTVGEL